MPIQHPKQLHQRQRGFGLAVFIAGKRVHPAAKNLSRFALVQRQLLASELLERHDEHIVNGGEFQINQIG
jgi:hypothetical protein